MAVVRPFAALRPAPAAAPRVAAVPYDVVSVEEARALAAGNPLSFLHVSRAEIDLPPDTDPYADVVYERAADNYRRLVGAAPLVTEAEPSLYCYRLRMGAHEQTGLAASYSLEEYDRDLIRKHERTRRDKEDDRTRHMIALGAQTGPVFLVYRASRAIDALVARVCAGEPLVDFEAPDAVRHTIWRAPAPDRDALVRAFAAVPALYIADGHHRAASAARARASLAAAGAAGLGSASPRQFFLAVAFPDAQVQILPYHRTVRDLAGLTADRLLEGLRRQFTVRNGGPTPERKGEVSMYLAGRWHTIVLGDGAGEGDRSRGLDVSVLQDRVIAPILGVADVRTDPRIEFVGGARGPGALEAAVDAGRAAVAFSMHPVTIDDLMAIADVGGIMPPKSTWFEPKLRDGLLIHEI